MSAAPTPEQSARFYELAKGARRPRWVPAQPAELWEDILAGALARCFECSERRKPIDREPPPGYARYLAKIGKTWDPAAYFWEQRLSEELGVYKTAHFQPKLSQTQYYGAAVAQPIANSVLHAVIAEETADAIYSSLDERPREIARLAANGCSAREIERETGIDRGKVLKVLRGIASIVDEADVASIDPGAGGVAPDAGAEWSPRSYVQGAPAALRAAGSTDWTISKDLARLLPPREPKPHRPVRTPEDLTSGRVEVERAVAKIKAQRQEILERPFEQPVRMRSIPPIPRLGPLGNKAMREAAKKEAENRARAADRTADRAEAASRKEAAKRAAEQAGVAA